MAGKSAPPGAARERTASRGERAGHALARFLHGHRWWVVVGALAFTAFAAWRVPDLIANIRVNRGALQDPENPVRKRFDHVVSQFGTPFLNIVVLEGDDRASLRQTADAVAAALSVPLPAGVAPTGDDPCADPRFVGRSVRDVFHRVDLGQFERKGIYYLSVEDLRALGEGLAGADREGGAGMPPLTGLQDALDGIIEGFSKGSAGAGEDAAKDARSVQGLADALGRVDRWLDRPYPEERLGEAAGPQLGPDDRRGVDELGYLSQGENPIRMFLFVRPVTDSEDEKDNRCFTTAVRTIAHGEARRVSAETGKRVRAVVTGMPAIVTDEMTLVARDAARVALYSGAAIFLLLLLYFRSARAAIMLLLPLGLALFWTLGLVSVTVGRLTLISSYFGGVLLGLGVDYAVQLYLRYNDERLRGRSEVEAAGLMLGQTGGAILTAAVMTTLAFIGVGMTEFLGFAELGQIVAIAIWMIFLCTMVLLPVFLFWFHKPKRYGMTIQQGLHAAANNRVGRVGILAVTLGVIAFGGVTLKDAKLDWDALNLLPASAESVVGQKALSKTEYSADTAIVTASSPEELRERVGRLEALREGAGKDKGDECAAHRPVVGRVESAERYERLLPEVSEAKIEAVLSLRRHKPFLAKLRGDATQAFQAPPAIDAAKIAESLETIADDAWNVAFDLQANEPDSPLTPAITALAETSEKLAGRIRQGDAAAMARTLAGFQDWLMGQLSFGLRLVLEGLDLEPLEVRALPVAIDARFRSRDGEAFAAYVYPTGNVGDRDFLPCLVGDLQAIDPGATGFPMTHLVNAAEIESSFRSATIYAFVAVLISLLIYMRNLWHVLVTLVPLLFGALLVAGLQWAIGKPFNFVNVMALPVLICTGVDYGVYLVHRYREDPSSIEGFSSTSAGVMLCALTTIIGFSVLMISDHVGMWSLGFSLSIGIAACWVAAQFAVPAMLFAGRRAGGAAPAAANAEPAPEKGKPS